MGKFLYRLLLLIAQLVAQFVVIQQAGAEPAAVAKVAAAADLQYALPEIVQAFAAGGEPPPRLSFGSSGVFAHQIANGAPFEIFLSADESYVALVHQGGRAEDAGTPYATGRLALFIARGAPIVGDRDLADLGRAAGDGRLKRLAIANPEHAPYGRAAREALQHLGLWPLLESKLVLGENAAQAAQFVASGNAQAGILPLSLARAPALADKGAFMTLPQSWHAPLRQRMVLLKGAGENARRFYRYLGQGEARAILARHGFGPP